jgi:hypothetical protein
MFEAGGSAIFVLIITQKNLNVFIVFGCPDDTFHNKPREVGPFWRSWQLLK